MKLVGLYLWKEWREQRAGILGLLLVLPLLPLAALGLGRGDLLDTTLLRAFGAGAGALAALLVVGAHLIPGELSGGGLRFLERLPGGLQPAFLAKLTLFLLVVGGFSLYGFEIAELALRWRGQELEAFDLGRWIPSAYLLPGLLCVLWVFAVSAWVPNGPLALPAGALCPALLLLPLYCMRVPWLEPSPAEQAGCFLFVLAAALVCGWVSMTRGLRHGGRRGRAALFGLTAALILVSPMWAWAGYRQYRSTHVDPLDPAFAIDWAWVNGSGDRALVGAHRESADWSPHAPETQYLIKLDTGEWERVADEASLACTLESMGFDTGRGTHEPAPDPGLPEGANCLPRLFGLGFRVILHGQGIGLYDAGRKRFYPNTAFVPQGSTERVLGYSSRLLMLSSCWLIPGKSSQVSWTTLDPDSGERSNATLPMPGDRVIAVMSDEELLVQREQDLLFLNLDTGRTRWIVVRGGAPSEWCVEDVQYLGGMRLPMDSPSVVGVPSSPSWLDPARGELTRFETTTWRLVKQDSPSSFVVIEDKRRLVRIRMPEQMHELLFPRD